MPYGTDWRLYSSLKEGIRNEEEEPDRNGKRDYCQREKGDAEAEAYGVGPQRLERPGRAARRTACRPFPENVTADLEPCSLPLQRLAS